MVTIELGNLSFVKHAEKHQAGGGDGLPLNTLPVTGDVDLGGNALVNADFDASVDAPVAADTSELESLATDNTVDAIRLVAGTTYSIDDLPVQKPIFGYGAIIEHATDSGRFFKMFPYEGGQVIGADIVLAQDHDGAVFSYRAGSGAGEWIDGTGALPDEMYLETTVDNHITVEGFDRSDRSTYADDAVIYDIYNTDKQLQNLAHVDRSNGVGRIANVELTEDGEGNSNTHRLGGSHRNFVQGIAWLSGDSGAGSSVNSWLIDAKFQPRFSGEVTEWLARYDARVNRHYYRGELWDRTAYDPDQDKDPTVFLMRRAQDAGAIRIDHRAGGLNGAEVDVDGVDANWGKWFKILDEDVQAYAKVSPSSTQDLQGGGRVAFDTMDENASPDIVGTVGFWNGIKANVPMTVGVEATITATVDGASQHQAVDLELTTRRDEMTTTASNEPVPGSRTTLHVPNTNDQTGTASESLSATIQLNPEDVVYVKAFGKGAASDALNTVPADCELTVRKVAP